MTFTRKNGKIFRLQGIHKYNRGFPDNKDSFVRNQGFRLRAETDVPMVQGSTRISATTKRKASGGVKTPQTVGCVLCRRGC